MNNIRSAHAPIPAEVTAVTVRMMIVIIQDKVREGALRGESTHSLSESPSNSSKSSEPGTLVNFTIFSDCQLNIASASIMKLLEWMGEGKNGEGKMRIPREACQQPQERPQGTFANTNIFLHKEIASGIYLQATFWAQLPSYPASRSTFRILHPFNIVSGAQGWVADTLDRRIPRIPSDLAMISGWLLAFRSQAHDSSAIAWKKFRCIDEPEDTIVHRKGGHKPNGGVIVRFRIHSSLWNASIYSHLMHLEEIVLWWMNLVMFSYVPCSTRSWRVKLVHLVQAPFTTNRGCSPK